MELAEAIKRPAIVRVPSKKVKFGSGSEWAVPESESEIIALLEAMHNAEALNAKLLEEVSSAKVRLNAMEASTSWRLTAPLRGGVMALRAFVSSPKQVWRELEGELRVRSVRTPAVAPVLGVPLNERQAEKPLFVGIGDGAIPSIRLGLQMPLEAIAKERGGTSRIYYESDLPSFEDVKHAEVIFFKRTYMSSTVTLAKAAAAANIPIVYMIDDDFWSIPSKSPLGQRFLEFNAFNNIAAQVKLAKHTVVWSPAVRKRLEPLTERISKFRGPSNAELFDNLPPPPAIEGPETRIGYAGGSTHADDLLLVKEPILKLLSERPTLMFESIGLEISWLEGHPQYRHFKGTPSLEEFYALLQSRSWTLAVAPLVDNKFNLGKSDNKFREYSGAGLPGVYSKMPVYSDSVVDLVDGLLTENTPNAWYNSIADLLDDPKKRAMIAQNAKTMARTTLSEANTLKQYSDVLHKVKRKPLILAIGPQHLPTFRIDVHAPFSILEAKGELEWRGVDTEDVTHSDIDRADAIVVVRALEPKALGLVEYARAQGKAVIYSWDDNWLQFPKDGSKLSNFIWRQENQASLKQILRHSDVVKASTIEIYKASLRYNPSVVMYPYGFDLSLKEKVKRVPKSNTGARIGYFGTAGRDSQFDFVLDALKLVQERHPDAEIEFFGFVPERAKELKNVKAIDYRDDYEGSVRQFLCRSWDIGLAPLAPFAFNRAKLPTKYRDYAAGECAGIYSNITCYQNVVTHRKTGLLCENTTQDWAEAILELIEKPEMRVEIATAALDHLKSELSAEHAAGWWRDTLHHALMKSKLREKG
jgi:processive 1,2-diacylglycerol beta-glucosyltransferase